MHRRRRGNPTSKRESKGKGKKKRGGRPREKYAPEGRNPRDDEGK